MRRHFPGFITLVLCLMIQCGKEPVAPEVKFRLRNGGFEEGSNQRPYYWFVGGSALFLWDSTVRHSGKRSVMIKRDTTHQQLFAFWWQSITTGLPLGKRVSLSAYVKTRDVRDGAFLSIRCDDRYGQPIAFETTRGRYPIEGTAEWRDYTIQLTVPPITAAIFVFLGLRGEGRVWFDDVRLKVEE